MSDGIDLEVSLATAGEAAIVAQLLELYVHELSDLADLAIGPDGRFGYGPLPRYWTEAGRHPYLVRLGGELAGLVLVQQGSQVSGSPDVWDVTEFFVLRRHRGRGVGRRVAREVWRRHPGAWEVRVMERNVAALGFWRRVVAGYSGVAVEPAWVRVGDKAWYVFRLSSAV